MATSKKATIRANAAIPGRIEFVTENGFHIMRRCELERGPVDLGSGCHFMVRNPNGWERNVTVEFDEVLIDLVQKQRFRERAIFLTSHSTFWLHCAERHLAAFLWESQTFPPEGRLMVHCLSSEELRMAVRWSD